MEYVSHRHHAAETAVGVNCMWLERPDTPADVHEVKIALEELVANGLLEKHRLPGDATIYRRVLRDRG